MKAKKILVTGAAGFIGRQLANELTRRGHQVTGVDSLLKSTGDTLPPSEFPLVQADLCDADLAEVLGDDFDEAYHLAAIVGVAKVCANPELTLRVNTISTFRFLDWARNSVRGRTLFASSCENYASFFGTDCLPMPTPESVYLGIKDIHNPRWTYAASKILGELAFAHCGSEFSIVRYHNVYGPAMYSKHVIPELFSRIWQGESPLRVQSPADTRSFCHIRDAVAGTIAAMESDASRGKVVNVGSDDQDIAIADLARRIVAISGRNTPVEGGAEVRGSVSRRLPDVGVMRGLMDTNYSFVTLDDGLRSCWDWQRSTGWIA